MALLFQRKSRTRDLFLRVILESLDILVVRDDLNTVFCYTKANKILKQIAVDDIAIFAIVSYPVRYLRISVSIIIRLFRSYRSLFASLYFDLTKSCSYKTLHYFLTARRIYLHYTCNSQISDFLFFYPLRNNFLR